MKPLFGIISWFPDDHSRKARQERLNRTFKQILNLWPDAEFLVIAQNWGDYKPPKEVTNIEIVKKVKLGILGARKALREEFLKTDYDYLIMCDDDILLQVEKTFTPEYFMEELEKHPEGYMFIQCNGFALTFCAISRWIYERVPMVDIDPEKEEGYEDVVFPAMLRYKYPDNQFITYGIRFVQHQSTYSEGLKSTWNKGKDHGKLRKLSNWYIERFKQKNFNISDDIKEQALVEYKKNSKPKRYFSYLDLFAK